MLEGLKNLIKAPRIKQLNRAYKWELDSQYISYDSWIRQKELEYLAGTLPNTKDIQVIEYSEIGKTVPAADVVLYTSDRHKLSIRALHAVISVFNEYKDTLLVYGDEDEYNSAKTIRMNPIYRPEWSPDTLRNYFYMGNVVALKKEIIPDNVSDIYELVIKATDGLNASQVRHVDYVLYHNNYSKSLYLKDDRFAYKWANYGTVSIVIPSKDNPDVLGQLLASICKLTTGVLFEIIVIDNGSDEKNKIKIKGIIEETKGKNDYLVNSRYIYEPQEFNFSKICNMGAGAAIGDFILLLNDDMEVRDSKWLLKMTAYAVKPHVGAVGAKLYYPDSKMIQHCGITNLRLGPVHKLQYKKDDHVYYDHANDIDRNVLAVTGACLMVRKELYKQMGGLDEGLKVAFNDVDFCYSLYEAGYYNVVVNTTHLWHYESLSRGDDESKEKLERLARERTYLYEKHPKLYAKDPYYHDYLTNDILDSNYTYAYEYEYEKTSLTKKVKPKKISYKIKDAWYNECLIISLEQCGSLKYWLGPEAGKDMDDDIIYIGGYSFVAGSDNACFDFKILLKGESGIYEMPCNKLYRPDLEINLDPLENAVLCGFSLRPDTDNMPAGQYQVGLIARGLASRLILCRFTNRYITIK